MNRSVKSKPSDHVAHYRPLGKSCARRRTSSWPGRMSKRAPKIKRFVAAILVYSHAVHDDWLSCLVRSIRSHVPRSASQDLPGVDHIAYPKALIAPQTCSPSSAAPATGWRRSLRWLTGSAPVGSAARTGACSASRTASMKMGPPPFRVREVKRQDTCRRIMVQVKHAWATSAVSFQRAPICSGLTPCTTGAPRSRAAGRSADHFCYRS